MIAAFFLIVIPSEAVRHAVGKAQSAEESSIPFWTSLVVFTKVRALLRKCLHTGHVRQGA